MFYKKFNCSWGIEIIIYSQQFGDKYIEIYNEGKVCLGYHDSLSKGFKLDPIFISSITNLSLKKFFYYNKQLSTYGSIRLQDETEIIDLINGLNPIFDKVNKLACFL